MNVYSNGSDGNMIGVYQCVELVNRLITTRGWSPSIWGNANEFYGNASTTYFNKYGDGSGYQPVPGDIVVWGGGEGGYGHVAVVDANDDGMLTVAEQNASPSGYDAYPISSSGYIAPTGSGAYRHYVEGFLHPKADNYTNSSGSNSGSGSGNPTTMSRVIAAAAHPNGEQDVFWKGTDNNLWEAFWANNTWNGPYKIGMGPLNSPPSVTVLANGNEDVFWKGTDNNLWEAVWKGSAWSRPVSVGIGPLSSQPSATSWGNEVDVFWRGTDNNLWEAVSDNGTWSGPYELGMGPLGSAPAAAAQSDGEQDVFWQGTDDNLWEAFYTNNTWNGPYKIGMGPISSAPTVDVRPSTGEEDVFWTGTDNALWEGFWASNQWNGPFNIGMGAIPAS